MIKPLQKIDSFICHWVMGVFLTTIVLFLKSGNSFYQLNMLLSLNTIRNSCYDQFVKKIKRQIESNLKSLNSALFLLES